MAPPLTGKRLTLVYQHELPNVPGQSIKGVLVEYGPGGYSRLTSKWRREDAQ